MLIARVMPCLLLRGAALVKTIQFRNPGYVGAPINAIRIYNEKEVDELIFLDIAATAEGKCPPLKLLSEIASECFMPVAYGGGVSRLEDVDAILSLGIEKVVINSHAVADPSFITRVAGKYGSQAVVVSVDVKRTLFGKYEVFTHGGRKATGLDPAVWAVQAEEAGAGEILVTSIDRDGTGKGYDIELLKRVTSRVSVPVVASGGAGKVEDCGIAVREGGASAAALGSMAVYHGRNRAVLINFPTRDELDRVLPGGVTT
ncbi:MAG TPA: AglZ/HisF2 family acetamidino modification protein [Thermoanaerobaculia bacterium]|nr:AglZ/HisF2 family acetamidino modification protein [Thermoanaerobaculia bacterium]